MSAPGIINRTLDTSWSKTGQQAQQAQQERQRLLQLAGAATARGRADPQSADVQLPKAQFHFADRGSSMHAPEMQIINRTLTGVQWPADLLEGLILNAGHHPNTSSASGCTSLSSHMRGLDMLGTPSALQ